MAAARQVRQKREQRLVGLEAQQQAQAQASAEQQGAWTAAGDRPGRLAEELIIGAMRDADEVLQLIKAQVVAGVSPALTLPMLGEWADRVARIGKIVTDGSLEQKLFLQCSLTRMIRFWQNDSGHSRVPWRPQPPQRSGARDGVPARN